MAQFNFSTLAGGVRTGFTTVSDILLRPVSFGLDLGQATASRLLLPAPAKRPLRSQITLQAPTSAFGTRQTTREAVTVANPVFRVWNAAKDRFARFSDNLKFGFASQLPSRQKSPVITLREELNRVGNVGITTLADRLVGRLVPRRDAGDVSGNTPVTPNVSEIHFNDRRSPAPATIPVLGDIFRFLQGGSQPVGTFSTGFPQSEPVPVPFGFSPTTVERAGSPNLLLFGAIGVVVFLFATKRLRLG